MTGELPLRIIDTGRGIIVRCLCGAESATLRRATVNTSMPGLRSSGAAMTHASPDLTPAGILRMAVHAKNCLRGRNNAQEAP